MPIFEDFPLRAQCYCLSPCYFFGRKRWFRRTDKASVSRHLLLLLSGTVLCCKKEVSLLTVMGQRCCLAHACWISDGAAPPHGVASRSEAEPSSWTFWYLWVHVNAAGEGACYDGQCHSGLCMLCLFVPDFLHSHSAYFSLISSIPAEVAWRMSFVREWMEFSSQ